MSEKKPSTTNIKKKTVARSSKKPQSRSQRSGLQVEYNWEKKTWIHFINN